MTETNTYFLQIKSGSVSTLTREELFDALVQAKAERDRAVAEAATLRLSLSTALSGYSDLLDAAEPIDEAESGRYTEQWERISKACFAVLEGPSLATRAAAVLAEIADWDQKPDVNPYGDSQGKLYDVWEKAQEYRAELAGQDVADDEPPSAREQA